VSTEEFFEILNRQKIGSIRNQSEIFLIVYGSQIAQESDATQAFG